MLLLTPMIAGISNKSVPVIAIESMAIRARPSYTRDFLTPGICSLIKPAAMVKLMQFPAKIHTVILWYWFLTRRYSRLNVRKKGIVDLHLMKIRPPDLAIAASIPRSAMEKYLHEWNNVNIHLHRSA